MSLNVLVRIATVASSVALAFSGVGPASAADDDLIWSATAADQPAQHFNVQTIADSVTPGVPPFGLNPFDPRLSEENRQVIKNDLRTTAPMCSSATQIGCIESVKYALVGSELQPARELDSPGQRAFAWGRCSGATCDDLAYTSTYSADDKTKLMTSVNPLLFDLPSAPHSRGSQYWINASLRGRVNADGAVTYTGVDFSVIAARVVPNQDGQACPDNFVETTAKSNRGYCNYSVNVPLDLRIEIKLRMGSRIRELSGWFDGRLNNAVIDFGKESSGVVSVEGSAVSVPITITNPIPYGDPLNTTDPAVDATRPVGTLGITDSRHGMDVFDRYKKVIAEKAYRQNAIWRLTMWTQEWGSTVCNNSTGINGIMITNASAYDPGPPAWNPFTRQLDFRVAGPHLLKNGDLNSGYYNLLLDENVAKCLWGANSLQAKATISVSDGSAQQDVATSVYQRKNGWVNFIAAGFHFSSPNISVGLMTDQKPIRVKVTTVVCVSKKNAKSIKRITGVQPRCPIGFKQK